MKILNAVVHLGGGIGTTLKNFFDMDRSNTHTIACLNPYDERSMTITNHKIYYDLKNNYNQLNSLVESADVVILHWYNHPAYYDLLLNNGLPKCRLIIWALANNLHAPYSTPKKLIEMSDKFILSSEASYESEDYKNLSKEQKDKFDCIWCSADMSKYYKSPRIKHDTFNIGYAGTIDFNSKLHPEFVSICKKINDRIENVHFIVCSSGPHLEKLKQQIEIKGLSDKFEFTGRVDDLRPHLSRMDVFLYTLYDNHYGTSEQMLGEAMCSGAIPVVLDNSPEKQIVKNNINGIVSTVEDIPSRIFDLYNDRYKLEELSTNAKESANKLYDTKVMISKWNVVIQSSLFFPKKERKWTMNGSDIFKESIGSLRTVFDENNEKKIIELFKSNNQWVSISKGSIIQYALAYPEDEQLQKWKTIAERILINEI